MRILFFTSEAEDYLQDQALIGLRGLFGESVVDYPKKDVLYEACKKTGAELYGCGFTIWKILPDININRDNIYQRIAQNEFDIIVFSSIWRQKSFFRQVCLRFLFLRSSAKLVFLDGEDFQKTYIPALFFGKYYKRELASFVGRKFTEQISFSIPDNKIALFEEEKRKMFAKHVQCEEAYKIAEVKENCSHSYAFSDESAYYKDIASSYYAITMKKAGWDCMRHYEIAGNGTVPCFYQFSSKPDYCAPHGFIDMHNMLVFNTADELLEKIGWIEKNNRYADIRANALKWAKANSCTQIAGKVLDN